MIKTFALPQFRVGSSIKELIDFHLQGHKNYSPLQRIREHSREHMAKEHMMKYYNISEKQFQSWIQEYKGFDIDGEIDKFIQDEKININIYDYDTEQKIYYQSKTYKYQEDSNEATDESSEPSAGPFGAESDNEPVSVPEFNVLICTSENNETHAFYIQNKETLTGLKFCPFCKSRAFDPKEHHFVEQYEKHIKKCEINEGKIIKEVKLEAVQRPFCPHIMQNKTYAYLLANNRENEFKPTSYYITYDFETVEKVINKDFGKSSKQISQLVPLSVASTIKNKQEVPIVGFNSAKFDFALIFKNLQSLDWEIKSYIGSSSQAKSIIVQHKRSQIKLKFCDIMVYVQAMTLKDFAQNFGEEAMKQMQEITNEGLKLLAQARSRGLLEKAIPSRCFQFNTKELINE
ncbi:MAG: hypothetical protein EZS28_035159 [Streblomastix strix]|uniref:Uncharacterized protein n=1 Tax=Streblomastix strix TaxID=222440 RepID=A0A5J4UGF3_9EUKA|nr:MAG: hypothetical protein EZS28_035159 [Streblomastix strix]